MKRKNNKSNSNSSFNNNNHKKSKSNNVNNDNKEKQYNKRNPLLLAGSKGFLFTCDTMRQREAVREAYNLLDEYIEMLYPSLLKKNDDGVYNDDGYTWRFVQNERIPYLKLEKIVDRDLHQDTEQEKAQKIVDALQNAEIEKNKADIENIKNGKKS